MGKEQKPKKDKKKPKKPNRILTNIFSVLLIFAVGFLLYTIFLISSIEKEIIYIVMAAIFLLNILFLILLRKLMNKKKVIRYILFIFLTLILSIGQAGGGYYIFRAYSTLTRITDNKVTTYKTVALVKANSNITTLTGLKDKKIGMISDKTSVEGYVLALEFINKEGLRDKNTIIDYEDNSSLMEDLYDGKIDIIFISSNYSTMFTTADKFKNISNDTKVIKSYEKKLSKNEVANLTGEEIIGTTGSNSITKPFTVLIMGIDSISGTTGNGDSLMLITFNPKTLNATVFSIPRDTYVPVSCLGGRESKITHAAGGGQSCMIKTIENFTGVKIDYYVKVNFKGLVKIVDALGGVDIVIPDHFDGVCEQNSDRKWGSKKICFKKGKQHLNGEAALAFARHRKTLLTGDLERGTNQQIVMQGIISKLKSVKSANQALEILDAIGDSMETNFTTKQILNFYDIAKSIFITSKSDTIINMQQLSLAGSGQMIIEGNSSMLLWNYIPNKCSLNQIVDAMKENLKEKNHKSVAMAFNIEKPFKIEVIGQDNLCATQRYSLLPNFTGKTVSYVESWCRSNGKTCNITYASPGTGKIISQSLPQGKRLDQISSITFKEGKANPAPTPKPEDPDDSTDPIEDITDPIEDITDPGGEGTTEP